LARERACSISLARLSISSSYSSRLASLISAGRCRHSFRAVLTSARSSQRTLNSSSSSNRLSICLSKSGNRSRAAASPRECGALSELDPITPPRRLLLRQIDYRSAVRESVTYYTRNYQASDGRPLLGRLTCPTAIASLHRRIRCDRRHAIVELTTVSSPRHAVTQRLREVTSHAKRAALD